MKIVTYNIQYSRGKDGAFDLDRIAGAVREADLIAMQEVTRNFPNVPDSDQPARLADLLPDKYWVYGAPVDVNGATRRADGTVDNRRVQFGNLILSRYPILSSRLWLLPKADTVELSSFQCGALEAVIDAPSGPLTMYCVHLDHAHHQVRLAQLDDLLPRMLQPAGGASVSGTDQPWLPQIPVPARFIMLGDCNFRPDSAEYDRVVGENDYYYGRRLDRAHLADSWVQAGNDPETGTTWYDEGARFETGSRLDYVFVSANLAHSVRGARIDGDASGSDHQPTWCELNA